MPEFLHSVVEPYRNVHRTFAKYWRAYGGWSALLCSPYFHASLLASIGLYIGLTRQQEPWFSLAVSVVPSLLGFTLAGYAFLLGVGDERFRGAIRGEGPGGRPSPFMVVNAAFVHFIVLQFLALFIAFIAQAADAERGLLAFVGIAVLCYSLLASLAAVMAVLNLADWYDKTPSEDAARSSSGIADGQAGDDVTSPTRPCVARDIEGEKR